MEDKQNSNGGRGFFYGYVIVIAAFLIMLLAYGIRNVFGIFFKPMATEFEWSRALTSGAVTLSMLVQGLWGILMGRFNDRIGSRWVITLCCFLVGVGFMLLSITHYSWQLYLFYGIIAGIGMGGVFVALVSTVARWFDKQRGIMTGIVLAGIGTGTFIVAPVANWLISTYNWQTAAVVIGAAVLVIGIAAAQFLRRDPAKMGLKSLPSDVKGLSFKEAISTRQFWMAGISFALLGYCTFTISIHLVPHITDLGISAGTAAGILAVTGAVSSVGGIVMGLFADRIGSRRIIVVSFLVVSVSLLLLIPIANAVLFYLWAAFYAFGIGGGTAMESTVVADLFGLKSHGLILGAVSFGFTVGAAVGPLVTGYFYDTTGNYRTAFLVSAAMGTGGLILAALLRPRQK
jgi:MFS family permease